MLTLYSTRALDRIFNDIWNNGWETYTPHYINPVKVKDGIAIVSYEVPGIPKDKLVVSWKDDVLTVVGKNDKRSVNYSVAMPDIDTSTLKAECVDGILTVSANIKKEINGTVTVKVF
jgi:HSP20 family molecular chaperone IbpA